MCELVRVEDSGGGGGGEGGWGEEVTDEAPDEVMTH